MRRPVALANYGLARPWRGGKHAGGQEDPDNDQYLHQSRDERSAHVGKGAAAVRCRCPSHQRQCRADCGEVRRTGQGPGRSLELGAGAAGIAADGEGQGQGGGPLEFLPAQCRNRRGAEQSGLCLYRRRTGQGAAGIGIIELLGARHRQHGSAGTGWHARAEATLAGAAARR